MSDEFSIRQLARDLKRMYDGLDEKKHERPRPREVRTMKPSPGPSEPGNWLWISRTVEMEQRLREVALNAFADIQVKLRADDMVVANLLDRISFNAQPISELDWADDFHQELADQERQIGKWLNPPDTGKVANADPYLTADSIQRSLTNKGLSCPPATVRSWAQRGKVATKQRRDGHTAYSLGDILKRIAPDQDE